MKFCDTQPVYDVQGLADGSLEESQADTSGAGPSHEDNRALALRQAATLLRDTKRVDAGTALQCLPWLIAASPELALGLLEVLGHSPPPPPPPGAQNPLRHTSLWSRGFAYQL